MAWSILNSDADISSQTLAYTVPVGYEGRLSASFCNRSTSATATVTLWVVPIGGVVGNEHLKESGTLLGFAGTSQATLERFFVAPAGTMVYVQASNANVSCQIQGDVVTPNNSSATESDGTSSVTYGDWVPSTGFKVKSIGSLVVIQGIIQVTPVWSGGTLFTLPAGFRPSTALYGIPVGKIYDPSQIYAPTDIGVWDTTDCVNISTAGVVTCTNPLNGAARYWMSFNVSFFV